MSEPVRAKWSLMFTMNLGNFQSLKVECSVEDSAHKDETAKELSDRVYNFVERELAQKVKEARRELDQ